jgi:integrase
MPKEKAGGGSGLKVITRAGTNMLYIRGSVRGRSIYQSAGTANSALAEEARAVLEAQLYRGAIHGERPKVAFAAAAEIYFKSGVSAHTQAGVDRITACLGPRVTCDQVDQNTIDGLAAKLCRPDAKPVTILRQIVTPVKAVLTCAAARGWCNPPLFPKIKQGEGRTDWFRPAEAEALISASADHLKPLLIFLFATGCRLGEAVALEWQDVDLRHGRVTFRGSREDDDGSDVRGTKNGRDRLYDLPMRALVTLANLPGDRDGRVFLHPEKAAKEIRFRRDGAIQIGRQGSLVGRMESDGRRWRLVVGQDEIGVYASLRMSRTAFRELWIERMPVRMVPYRLTGDTLHGPSGGQIRSAWGSAMAGARIKRRLTPHHARHTWASWHYCVHKDLLRLRDEGGWRTTAMCERYTKLVPNGMKAEIEAFWSGAGIAESVQPSLIHRLTA